MSLLALYGLAGSSARPVLRRMLRRRLSRGKELPARIGERYGIATLPRPAGKLIWIHAASVGETMSVLPVIAALAGDAEVLLTTGTVTSATLAAGRLPSHARHQFVPLDVVAWIEPFLEHWRPQAAVFVESELWPATLARLDARGIPRLLINARMSRRSAQRWALLPRLAGRLLGGFRFVHAQSAQDATHLRHLGLIDILQWGNLKFAAPVLPVDGVALAAVRARLAGPVWLAASTHAGEEPIIMAAHRQLRKLHAGLITIIVPRHPERGEEILQRAGDLPVARRSRGEAPVAGGIYLADTLGELGLFYRLVSFAFIGGSLVRHGGQNVVEPARLGIALLTGPHTENFSAAVAALEQAAALRRVAGLAELVAQAGAWLLNPKAAARAGRAAAGTFETTEALAGRIAALILQAAA